ncbi:hypothetical protein KUL156_18580 [Alteromonas sp. KUL156]|nr:hypothetical protein KUL154_45040 [Alteromonas sp. KUL154]GFD99265.1 hypothetical protein KUL156_18580 [Alteromonas sp. KUL156]
MSVPLFTRSTLSLLIVMGFTSSPIYAIHSADVPEPKSAMQLQSSVNNAIALLQSDVINTLSVGGVSLYLHDMPNLDGRQVYQSDDKKNYLILNTRKGNVYGSAVINGQSYSIYDGEVTLNTSDFSVKGDSLPLNGKAPSRSTLEQEGLTNRNRSLSMFDLPSIHDDDTVNNNAETITADGIAVFVDSQQIEGRKVSYSGEIGDITSDLLFSSAQASQILSNPDATVVNYMRGDEQDFSIKVDHLITAGMLLETYYQYGDEAYERIFSQIDSKIAGANLIFQNSLSTHAPFVNNEITLVSDYSDFNVGNSVIIEYTTGEQHILYAVTDTNSIYWSNFGLDVCGFAQAGTNVAMENPDVRTIAYTGLRNYGVFNPDNPNFMTFNVHGVSRTDCLTARVFAHEVGHMLGMNHDRFTDEDVATDFGFNYGFRDEEVAKTFSLMAYRCDGCRYEPLISSPDRYDDVLGVNAYEIDGADGALFADTTLWTTFANRNKQPQFIPSVSSVTDPQTQNIISKTYTWDIHPGGDTQTLIIANNFSINEFYAFELPQGADTVTIDTSNLPDPIMFGRIITGLNANEALQPIFSGSLKIDARTPIMGSSSRALLGVEQLEFPDVIESGQTYEFGFVLTEDALTQLQNKFADNRLTNWQVSFQNFGLLNEYDGSTNHIISHSSLEDIVETGIIHFTFAAPEPTDIEANTQHFNQLILSDAYSTVLASITYEEPRSDGTISTRFIAAAQYDVLIDEDSFLGATFSAVAKKPITIYRKEDATTPLNVRFNLKPIKDDYDYTVVEGNALDGISQNAITDINEVINGDGTVSVNVSVNPQAITQQQGDGYFITLQSAKGLPVSASTLLKDNDIPYFGNNPEHFFVDDTNFDVDLIVEDLQPGVNYQAHLDLLRSSTTSVRIGTIEAERITDTQMRFTRPVSLDNTTENAFTLSVFPVDEAGEPTGSEELFDSHRYAFTASVNQAPVITCESTCDISISGVGEYTFDQYTVSDDGNPETLMYDWTSTNAPYPVNQVGNDVVIFFPEELDTKWESFTLSLSVSDGSLDASQTFTISNQDYESDAGNGTSDGSGANEASSAASSSTGGGGTTSIMALFGMLLLTYLRRNKQ